MKPNNFLYFDEAGDKIRYIASTERSSPSVQNHIDIVNMNSAHGRIRLLIGNTGSDEQFLVDNTIVSCKRNLRAGAGLESNTINSIGNANFNIQRDGSTAITLKAGNEVDFSGYVNINNISTTNDTDMALRRNDEEFIRLFKDETTSKEAIICYKILRVNDEVKTNTINSIDNNDLVFERDGTTRFTLTNTTTDFTGGVKIGKCVISQFSAGSSQIFQYTLDAVDSYIRYYVGGGSNQILRLLPNLIEFNKSMDCQSGIKTNVIDTRSDTDLSIRRSGDTFLTLDTTDGVKSSKSTTVEGADDYVYTNNLRHNTGTNLNIWTLSTIKFYSNAINKVEIKQTQIDINEDVVFASGKGLTVP